ncbi:BTB/POZ and MATH domain-containing protein 2 [Rhynchospora pubera]|uniref:BTB/POZ and MATH domain-containing protein 2 n=1 Tax=Rhynchospora pubera TaxID=906938 RepID=A0AAV8F778_9POAL|nr:BTB/POZ and MATH domain-containing protein 2 [Rhynchospora pubera]
MVMAPRSSLSRANRDRPETENLESTIIARKVVESCKGLYPLKVEGYSSLCRARVDVDNNCLSSQVFSIGGLNWIVDCYPKYGDRIAFDVRQLVRSRSDIKDDACVFIVKISLTMLVQDGIEASCNYRLQSDVVDLAEFNDDQFRRTYYVERNKLESPMFLKNDSFTIRFTIEVMKEYNVGLVEISKVQYYCSQLVQPDNLRHQLIDLLETEEGADVSFQVGHMTFHAHKFVLAARSPIFKEQLFGTSTNYNNNTIRVEDMDEWTFHAMLHFIYSDSLPELYDENQGPQFTLLDPAQRLMVAADRYGIERLKHICELKLYDLIDVDNLATIFTSAEQHNCSQLEAACIEFVKDPEILGAVVLTQGFEHMVNTYPAVLKQLLQKINHANSDSRSLQGKPWLFIARSIPSHFSFRFIIDAIRRFLF